MNVVVVIQGREAIPVRAIPFLTNWETMSPDVVATALAGEDFMSKFKHLRAYRLEFGAVKSIDQRYWGNFISQNLSGLSAKLRLDHPQHEIGYPTWQSESWKLLPAGAFVWKDEWEVEYHRRYGLGKYIRMTESGGVMQEEEHERSIALDFDPFIDDTRNQCIVMAGFDFQADVPYQELHSQPTTPNLAPVAAQSALGGVSWEKQCLCDELRSSTEAFSLHQFIFEDELAALDEKNPDAAELVRICLSGVAPDEPEEMLTAALPATTPGPAPIHRT